MFKLYSTNDFESLETMESYRIGNLPEELFHEILLRLPVKALLVCKCVCKDWCALIKSPSFVNRHFNHESNQECLILNGMHISEGLDYEDKGVYTMYDDERHSLVEAPDNLRQMPAHMITEGLEKGIFCLRLSSCLGLFNPATREFKKLPPIPQSHRQEVKNHPPWIGCGADPSTGDFKVVAFNQNKYCNYASVYTLSSDSWKAVETVDPYDLIGYCSCHGIPTLNGVKHWLTKSVISNLYVILAFDMRSEKFEEIDIPDALVKTGRRLVITTYCDLVAVLSYKCNECVDLWVMGRDGSWSKKFGIGITLELAFHQKYVLPLLAWKKNKVFFSEPSHLIMCDVSTQKVSTLEPMDPECYFSSCFIYKESLVSIKGEILVSIKGEIADSLLAWFD